MRSKWDLQKYDEEERPVIHAYEKGKIMLSSPSKKEIDAIKAATKKTMVKNKRITIRLYDHDYQGIQKRAMEMGVTYQTLISGIIHRCIEGELTSKTG
jgi:hypothetical protein